MARTRRGQREVSAEVSPLRDPELYQYRLDIPAVTEVWRRGSVIASWLLDLAADRTPLGQARHQVAELDLAELAAGLLVGENVLEPHDLARELGDVLLRRVDDGQPLLEVGHGGLGLVGLLPQRFPDPLGEGRQPLLEVARQRPLLGLQALGGLGLGRRLALGHLREPPRDLRLPGVEPREHDHDQDCQAGGGEDDEKDARGQMRRSVGVAGA